MSKIIGLDLATSTGVSIFDTETLAMTSRTWALPSDPPLMFHRFSMTLSGLLAREKPDIVGFEWVPHPQASKWAAIYFGLRAIVLERCERALVSSVPVTIHEVKRAATGSGKATKDEIMIAAARRWSEDPPDTHDEADARFIAIVAAGHARRHKKLF